MLNSEIVSLEMLAIGLQLEFLRKMRCLQKTRDRGCINCRSKKCYSVFDIRQGESGEAPKKICSVLLTPSPVQLMIPGVFVNWRRMHPPEHARESIGSHSDDCYQIRHAFKTIRKRKARKRKCAYRSKTLRANITLHRIGASDKGNGRNAR